MEISITSPSGQSVPNNVIPLGPGLFVISFIPQESGLHKANITFNQENVNGYFLSTFNSFVNILSLILALIYAEFLTSSEVTITLQEVLSSLTSLT